MKSKVEKLYEEVCGYQERSIVDNISERLQRTLDRYLEDLECSSERLRGKKNRVIYKELSK